MLTQFLQSVEHTVFLPVIASVQTYADVLNQEHGISDHGSMDHKVKIRITCFKNKSSAFK